MSFSLAQILLFIVVYLSGLFAVAYLADRGVIPPRITSHPAVYVLSLGVFAGAMASNGVMELAQRYGYDFLTYYLGVGLVFLLATLLLVPLLRLCRVYQLSSLADLLTFRFRSPTVGAAITIAMCLTLLPLLALQIQAVADSIHILSGSAALPVGQARGQHGLAQLFCVIIIVFSILFGTRHVSAQHRNTGLVTAIAFESVVKLGAMLALMLAAVFQVFGGFDELQQWVNVNGSSGVLDAQATADGSPRTLLLVFFSGAVCMPHIFHMAFAENSDTRDLRSASWGLPLYLLLLSLPVLPVTWAGMRLGHGLPVDYSGLGIALQLRSGGVVAAAFVAGLSAASATIIVTTLALANMCLNHLVLPSRLLHIDREQNIYIQLKWLRRGLIAVLILAGYGCFTALDGKQSLTGLALLAFAGTLQFLPGVIATLYWPAANRKGLLTGLAAGLLVWLLFLMLPVVINFDGTGTAGHALLPGSGEQRWSAITLASVLLNSALFVAVSLLTRRDADEQAAAEICSMDDPPRPTRRTLPVHTAAGFTKLLAPALGEKTAGTEVQRALQELHFHEGESRPYALRRLRARIESNLSGLLGPAVAHGIIERCIPFKSGLHPATEDINLIERKLDRAQTTFTGMAADLDNLRRHYRETLDNLPVGVCSVGGDGELLLWNHTLEQITDIPSAQVLGSLLTSLAEPWRGIIDGFLQGGAESVLKREVIGDSDNSRWVSLHRTAARGNGEETNTVILVEDITEFELLQKELLHSERLASIGRLAAGVAHEIGNPVTGIACLAQNLEYESDTGEIRHMARDILKQTDRVNRIVESLINFSHTGPDSGEAGLIPSNLADCVDEAINLLALDRKARPVAFHNHCDRELVVLADNQRLLQVFINLLSNARDACDENGEVQVNARCADGRVTIDVQDNGCGIPTKLQERVFEPFYTTKYPGEGTGLGLALVFSIMEEMGGGVQVTSPVDPGPRPGTRVTLQLAQASYGCEFEV